MNDDTQNNTLTTELRALGLHDAILTMPDPASPPATQNRNTSRTTINMMWVSPSVVVTRSGFCPFDSEFTMPSDHKLLWIKVDNSSILGKYLPTPMPKARPCKVNSRDQRSGKKYIRRVKLRFQQAKIAPTLWALQTKLQGYTGGNTTLLPLIIAEHNQILITTNRIRSEVKLNLRSYFAGKVAWSPQYKHYIDTIDFWKRILRLHDNVKTSCTILHHLALSAHLQRAFHYTCDKAIAELR